MITLKEKLQENKFVGVRNPDRLKDTIGRLAFCISKVAPLVRQQPIKDLSSFTGNKNVQGEQTQWLDEEANRIFKDEMSRSYCGIMVSEEEEAGVVTEASDGRAEYLLSYDPLDGSSNLGINIPVGSIFGIWQRSDPKAPATEKEFLQPGRNLIAAGYSIYGPATMLVVTWGNGVHEFVLNELKGEFVLTAESLEIPTLGKIYSCNEGNSSAWDVKTKKFIEFCKSRNEELGAPWGARYVGSLVADFHRNMKKGGIFLYPTDSKNARGKLRMLYECIPMAYICAAAGGKASDGKTNILDLLPTQIHERCPLILGSKEMVQRYENS